MFSSDEYNEHGQALLPLVPTCSHSVHCHLLTRVYIMMAVLRTSLKSLVHEASGDDAWKLQGNFLYTAHLSEQSSEGQTTCVDAFLKVRDITTSLRTATDMPTCGEI